jgi:hypothetical protein
MKILKELVEILDVRESETPSERVFYSRDLAKIGDAMLNYINVLITSAGYLSKSSKITNKMLREAVNKSGLRKKVKKRQTARDLGNIVEAIVAYLVLNELLTEDQIVEMVIEKRSFEEALASILKTFSDKIN